MTVNVERVSSVQTRIQLAAHTFVHPLHSHRRPHLLPQPPDTLQPLSQHCPLPVSASGVSICIITFRVSVLCVCNPWRYRYAVRICGRVRWLAREDDLVSVDDDDKDIDVAVCPSNELIQLPVDEIPASVLSIWSA